MTAASTSYLVRVGAVAAGILTDAGNHTSFAFIRSYLNNPERPILGQIFEDTPTRVWSHKTRVAPWFANLLPEGDLRAFLASSLGVSGVRDAPLLGAIGADLPGAVTLERADSLLTVESEPEKNTSHLVTRVRYLSSIS